MESTPQPSSTVGGGQPGIASLPESIRNNYNSNRQVNLCNNLPCKQNVPKDQMKDLCRKIYWWHILKCKGNVKYQVTMKDQEKGLAKARDNSAVEPSSQLKLSPSHSATIQRQTVGDPSLAKKAKIQHGMSSQKMPYKVTVDLNNGVVDSDKHSESPGVCASVSTSPAPQAYITVKNDEVLKKFLPIATAFLVASLAVLFVTVSPVAPSHAMSSMTLSYVSNTFLGDYQPVLALELLINKRKNNLTLSTVRATFPLTIGTISTALVESHSINSTSVGGTIEEHSVARPSVNYFVMFETMDKLGLRWLGSLFYLCSQREHSQENSSSISQVSAQHLSTPRTETVGEILIDFIFSLCTSDVIVEVIFKSMNLSSSGSLPAIDMPLQPELPHPLENSLSVWSPKELGRFNIEQKSLVPPFSDYSLRLAILLAFEITHQIFVALLFRVKQKFSSVVEFYDQHKLEASLTQKFCTPLGRIRNFSYALTLLQPYVSLVSMLVGSLIYIAITHQTEVVTVSSSSWDLESIVRPAQFSFPDWHKPIANISYPSEPSSSGPLLQLESLYWKEDCKNSVKKLLWMSDSPKDFSCGLYEVLLCVWNCVLICALCFNIHRTSNDRYINMKGVNLLELSLTPQDQLGLYTSALSCHPCALCLYLKELKSWFKNFKCSKALERYSVRHIPFSRIKSRKSFSHTYTLRNKISHLFQGNGPGRGTCRTFWRGLKKSNNDSSQAMFHSQHNERRFYWVAKTRGGRSVKKKVFGKYYRVHQNRKKPFFQFDFKNNVRKKVRETCGHMRQTSSWLAVLSAFKFPLWNRLPSQPALLNKRGQFISDLRAVFVLFSFIPGVCSGHGAGSSHSNTLQSSLLSLLVRILELLADPQYQAFLAALVVVLLVVLFVACMCMRRDRHGNHRQSQEPSDKETKPIPISTPHPETPRPSLPFPSPNGTAVVHPLQCSSNCTDSSVQETSSPASLSSLTLKGGCLCDAAVKISEDSPPAGSEEREFVVNEDGKSTRKNELAYQSRNYVPGFNHQASSDVSLVPCGNSVMVLGSEEESRDSSCSAPISSSSGSGTCLSDLSYKEDIPSFPLATNESACEGSGSERDGLGAPRANNVSNLVEEDSLLAEPSAAPVDGSIEEDAAAFLQVESDMVVSESSGYHQSHQSAMVGFHSVQYQSESVLDLNGASPSPAEHIQNVSGASASGQENSTSEEESIPCMSDLIKTFNNPLGE